jgi:hypothetical protein
MTHGDPPKGHPTYGYAVQASDADVADQGATGLVAACASESTSTRWDPPSVRNVTSRPLLMWL